MEIRDSLLESQLIEVWRHQLIDSTGLVTEEGEPIEIIYPGRVNDDQGADFRDAVIATSQGLIKGDVEVHVKSSGWQEHGHNRDAVYNQVILHVVMWDNTGMTTSLQNGREVPVLALQKYIRNPIARSLDVACSTAAFNVPCFELTQHLTIDTILRSLDRAGEERFLTKVARFQADLTQNEAGQSLYQSIMGAMGYSKNKLPFLELARRLPLKILESISQSEISDEECLARQQAWLLGVAGLLPTQCQDRQPRNNLSDRWVDILEKLWSSYSNTKAMSPYDWHLFKVRPSNSPVRRLIAMSYLILRYRERGTLRELVEMLRIIPIDRGFHRLENALVVIEGGGWWNHFNTGSGRGIGNTTLLGRSRAADIVLNVLLPFAFAWGEFTAQPELKKKSFMLYRCYPKLAANSIERHMRWQLGLSRSLVTSAQRQQGLIHIYNNLCTQGRCGECCLSQPEAGNNV